MAELDYLKSCQFGKLQGDLLLPDPFSSELVPTWALPAGVWECEFLAIPRALGVSDVSRGGGDNRETKSCVRTSTNPADAVNQLQSRIFLLPLL